MRRLPLLLILLFLLTGCLGSVGVVRGSIDLSGNCLVRIGKRTHRVQDALITKLLEKGHSLGMVQCEGHTEQGKRLTILILLPPPDAFGTYPEGRTQIAPSMSGPYVYIPSRPGGLPLESRSGWVEVVPGEGGVREVRFEVEATRFIRPL